ncbi:hypothetical protein BDN70DRAFT_810616 [Pholiota conissans]|uniref:Apple domain-containing protein n=1 Tax=Pholiota conissans TaxID=109636 RepID=A0A9P5Z0I5_9AGAR|nr:hypothetical protein BDN70DRAFT_810616 [Pholiota conissans]
MRFTTVVAAVAVAATGAEALSLPLPIPGWTVSQATGFNLDISNKYGSPIPPWKPGHKPGWYYGPGNPFKYPQYPCLGGIICKILPYFPHSLQCPKPIPPKPPHTTTTTKTVKTTSTKTTTVTVTTTTTAAPTPTPTNGYTPTFSNITAAVQADDFLTFGLVETIDDCFAMCNSVAGCGFVNTYHDVNGKGGSPDLTCSLFSKCHGPEDADNRGGQSQPDGSIDFIIDSDGFCKDT